ncbi:MAG: imidazolonepropionase [Flavobacteriales bacterium]|nr:imidazolonepropionase [Flavobacteriales bacterium]
MNPNSASSTVILRDIDFLVGAFARAPRVLKGGEMLDFPVLQDAWLHIESGEVVAFGRMEDFAEVFPSIDDAVELVSCSGRIVHPGYCDSHTHMVYAAGRYGEYVDRVRGLTYEKIAQRGGGILNSAAKLRLMPEDDLFDAAMQRVERAVAGGVVAMEIKSGYGLDLESELKMLRVIARVKAADVMPIRSTFLGCHAVPPEFDNASTYTDFVTREMLPAVAAEGLADYVDIFCEKGYFELPQTRQLIQAGRDLGLPSKVHVNQFNAMGGVALCVEMGARSVDHLEVLNAEDLAALSAAGGDTIPVALPLCSLFLDLPYTPARSLVDAALPVAIATDHNPGSAPCLNMHLAAALGCLRMGLLPIESLAASTLNGAAAMDVSQQVGHLSPGAEASLVITRPLNSVDEMMYAFGDPVVDEVMLRGRWVG